MQFYKRLSEIKISKLPQCSRIKYPRINLYITIAAFDII